MEDHCAFAMAVLFLLSSAHDFMLAVCPLYFVAVLCLLYLFIPQIEPLRFLIQASPMPHRRIPATYSRLIDQDLDILMLGFRLHQTSRPIHTLCGKRKPQSRSTPSMPSTRTRLL